MEVAWQEEQGQRDNGGKKYKGLKKRQRAHEHERAIKQHTRLRYVGTRKTVSLPGGHVHLTSTFLSVCRSVCLTRAGIFSAPQYLIGAIISVGTLSASCCAPVLWMLSHKTMCARPELGSTPPEGNFHHQLRLMVRYRIFLLSISFYLYVKSSDLNSKPRKTNKH